MDFLCERWIPFQAWTSVLCLHCRPETVHCSKKDVYTSEIAFLALQSLIQPPLRALSHYEKIYRVSKKIRGIGSTDSLAIGFSRLRPFYKSIRIRLLIQ